MIHREGYKIILISVISLVLINWGISQLVSILWLKYILYTGLWVLFGLILWFFRVPSRQHRIDPSLVIAPADGKMVVMEEVVENEYFQGPRRQLSIFMSPLNVHINRNPVGGKVKYVKYHPGKYLVAWHPKSSEENERSTVVIDNGNHEILFRQIAGAVARRIKYYVSEGQEVNQCDEMGFIKFGSRVDVFLPMDAEVKVKIDQVVRGGQTVLAKLN
jgi:phosphatidylserine decarboxylase